MAEKLSLKSRGLYTDPNQMSGIPDGAMSVAKNVSLDRAGRISPKRGLTGDGYPFTADFHQPNPLGYQDMFRACRHNGTRYGICRDQTTGEWRLFADIGFAGTGGIGESWADFVAKSFDVEESTASVAASMSPIDAAISRPRFLESGTALYSNTEGGLLRLDLPDMTRLRSNLESGNSFTGYLVASQAGLPRAQDIQSSVISLQTGGVDNYGTGFLQADTASAYRCVWVKVTNDGREIVSAPSGRMVVQNRTYSAKLARVGAPGTVITITLASGLFDTGAPPTNVVVNVASVTVGLASGTRTGNGTAPTSSVITSATNNLADVGGAIATTVGNTMDFGTRPVSVTVSVPDWVTSEHVLRVYRSPMSASWDSEPNDDMRQVYETSGLTGGTPHTFVDDVTDNLRRGPLYTNVSEEGPLAANDMPPVASDFIDFKGYTFAGNTRQRYQRLLTIMAVSGSNGIQNNDVIYVGELKYTFKTAAAGVSEIPITANPNKSPEQWCEDQARQLCKSINADTRNTHLSAFYVSGPNDFPGTVLIEQTSPGPMDSAHVFAGDSSGQLGFAIAQGQSRPLAFNPPLESVVEYTPLTYTRVSDYVTIDLDGTFPLGSDTNATVGAYITVLRKTTSSFRGGMKRISSENGAPDQPIYYEPGADATEVAGTRPSFIITRQTSQSVNGTCMATADLGPNRIQRSKFGEPESWPKDSWDPVGSVAYGISRLVPTRDSLFIFKDDGLFRLTGEDETSFRIEPFDTTVRLVAPESAVAFQNEVWFLSNQGVMSVSDSGVTLRSAPIDNVLRESWASAPDYVAGASWGCAYESDGAYLLGTINSSSSSSPDRIFVYYAKPGGWVDWDDAALFGFVDQDSDRLTTCPAPGTPAAGTTNRLKVERKTKTASDYAGEAIAATALQTLVAITGQEWLFSLPGPATHVRVTDGTSLLRVGDLIHQDDFGSGEQDSVVTQIGFGGDDHVIVTQDALTLQLGQELEFSRVSDDLSIVTFASTSAFSVGDVIEGYGRTIITAILNSTTVRVSPDVQLEGDVTIHKAFGVSVRWPVAIGGTPSAWKTFQEVSLQFAQAEFTEATVSFSSDLSAELDPLTVTGLGAIDWSDFPWQLSYADFDLVATQVRCLVPRSARRGTRLHVQFDSARAQEGWCLDGLGLTWSPAAKSGGAGRH